MDSENNVFVKVGGRKFVLAILVLISAVLVTLYKGQLDSSLAALMIGVLGAFGYTNVMAKKSTVEAERELNTEPVVAQADDGRIEGLEKNIEELIRGQESIVKVISSMRVGK